MKCCQVEIFKVFKKVTLYTIRIDGEELNEASKFFKRSQTDPKLSKEIEEIKKLLSRIGNQGALERNFRYERAGLALPVWTSNVRLYCHRVSNEILIIGNGGRKTSQKAQDSPDAFPHFSYINAFIKAFNKKLRAGEISVSGQELDGDLYFNIPEKQPKHE